MNKIIQYFLEKIISLEEKSLENLNNINFLSDLTDDMNQELMNLGKELILEYLNNLEEIIYESEERKEKYISYQKNSLANKRKLITIFGEIEFSRRYYQERLNEKEKIYLLDKAVGLEENERMLINVEEKMLNLATVKSYEFAGKNCAYNVEISKETVKNKIEGLDFSNIPQEKFEKKSNNTRLYIQADEDHVHLQIGGISMPRLITLYEENINGKLKGKKKFGGIYNQKIDDLWEEVYTYVENKYNYENIEKIFIMGDGANWIKTGLEWLPKSIYIADRFHLEKALTGLCGKDNKEQKSKIREAMYEFDYIKVKELGYEILAEEMEKSVRERKLKQLEYIINNEEGFKNSVCYDVPGCAAEGDISHTYSDRLSSRPLGWKEDNVDKMARLRILAANGENIKIVTRNLSKNKPEVEEKIKKQKQVSKMIKKEKYKREDGICYTIPEMRFGDYEMREKISELIKCKAI